MTDETKVRVPLDEYARQIAREAAREVIKEHVTQCTARQHIEDVEKRIGKLEVRFGTLIGLMVGSGGIGGAASGLLISFFGG